MHMGVDDVGDGHLGRLGFLDESVFVAGHHIDRHAVTLAPAAEKVGQRGILCGKLSKEHVACS